MRGLGLGVNGTTTGLSPLRLVLFVGRGLLDRGYGGLRFYSYDDDGSSRIWVAMYSLMDECGRNGEPLAFCPFWTCRFVHFRDDREWPSVFGDYLDNDLSVAQATTAFEYRYRNQLRHSRTLLDRDYIDWYDHLLKLCMNDGFPLTEEPEHRGYGPDGGMSEVLFSEPAASPKLYPRPPAFADTVFPRRQMLRELAERHARTEATQREANYAEWKRRIAEIDQRLKT